MRAYQFLLEYDRSREQQRIEALPAYQQRLKQDPKFSLEKLESGDPTPQKIYVPRLVQWWLAGEPVEDLISTTADALAKYHQLKNKKLIKPEHSDIGRFKTADQFTDAVDQYQLPTDEPKQDRGKYKEIFRDADLLVVQLLDETAAKFWGQNTKWCTAAKKNNMFMDYFKDGPLYVIIPRKDPANKYQFWWNKNKDYSNEYQFMDIRDKKVNPVDLSIFGKLQQIFEPIHQHIMWKSNPTEKEQLDAVTDEPDDIQYIKNPTEAVQMAAVTRSGWVIRWINNPSEAVQLAAVQQTGRAIQYIKKPSEQLQWAAVKQDGKAIKYIKNPSEQVQLAAVTQDGYAIQYINNPSEQVQLAAVSQTGWAIYHIKKPSEQVQMTAVTQNGYAIHYIKNPSEQVQRAAVTQDCWAIQLIKNPSEAVQMAAVREDPRSIQLISNPCLMAQLIGHYD